jgi:reductive dehalogenase
VAFDVEMSYSSVQQAPRMPITEESAQKYLMVAMISITLARYIRMLGHSARAHIAGSNYQVMLPPVAYDAGLGELGRLGYLISPRFGPRMRLGAVTTDLPLIPDAPIRFGVQDFCESCLKCATQCPSASIPRTGKSVVRGVEKWQLDIESCIRYWRKIGTDCGLCMKVCPFSHPESPPHQVIREGIRRSSFARWISVHADDLFYGGRTKL